MCEKSCKNCKNRVIHHRTVYDAVSNRLVDASEYCTDYVLASTNSNPAATCDRYDYYDSVALAKGYSDEDEDDDYAPTAARGDFSPSCPWNAPGMSINDFI